MPLAYMKGQLPPPLILPSIGEMFPLSVCMKVFGLGKDAGVERERDERDERDGVGVGAVVSPVSERCEL